VKHRSIYLYYDFVVTRKIVIIFDVKNCFSEISVITSFPNKNELIYNGTKIETLLNLMILNEVREKSRNSQFPVISGF